MGRYYIMGRYRVEIHHKGWLDQNSSPKMGQNNLLS